MSWERYVYERNAVNGRNVDKEEALWEILGWLQGGGASEMQDCRVSVVKKWNEMNHAIWVATYGTNTNASGFLHELRGITRPKNGGGETRTNGSERTTRVVMDVVTSGGNASKLVASWIVKMKKISFK